MPVYSENDKHSRMMAGCFWVCLLSIPLAGMIAQHLRHHVPAPYRDSRLVDPHLLCLIDYDARLSKQQQCVVQVVQKPAFVTYKFLHTNCTYLPSDGLLDPCRVLRFHIYPEDDYQPDRDTIEYVIRPWLDVFWYLSVVFACYIGGCMLALKPPLRAIAWTTLNAYFLMRTSELFTRRYADPMSDLFWSSSELRTMCSFLVMCLQMNVVGVEEHWDMPWFGHIILCFVYNVVVALAVLVGGMGWILVLLFLGVVTTGVVFFATSHFDAVD